MQVLANNNMILGQTRDIDFYLKTLQEKITMPLYEECLSNIRNTMNRLLFTCDLQSVYIE